MFVVIWILALLSANLWAFGLWAATHPNIVGKGQDAAGKGMAAGCLAILGGGAGTIAAIIGAIITWRWWGTINLATQLAGVIPISVIAVAFVFAWLAMKKSHAARMRDDRKRERRVNAIVIIAAEETLQNKLFKAFSSVQNARWQQLFSGIEALRWQFPNFAYRSALIAIHITPADLELEDMDILLGMFEAERPVGDVLLFGPDAAAIDTVAQRVKKAKWPVSTLIMPAEDVDGWVTGTWLPRALELAGPMPKNDA